jgi:hypothetical protein
VLLSLERDLGDSDEVFQLRVSPPALVDRERDGEILDREAGRVEDRDLVLVAAALVFPGEDAAELGDVLAAEAAFVDRAADVAVVARLLPGGSPACRPRARCPRVASSSGRRRRTALP